MKLVQIGANTGDDHVYRFLSEHKEKIELAILIEPLPFLIPALKDRYKDFSNVYFENAGIVDKEMPNGTINFYYQEGSPNYEVSSVNEQHVRVSTTDSTRVTSLEVPALTFDLLMRKYQIHYLDNLFVDAEGLDAHIIKSIDFSKYVIQNIYFESAHTDGVWTKSNNYNDLISYLTASGYKVSDVDNLNSKAVWISSL